MLENHKTPGFFATVLVFLSGAACGGSDVVGAPAATDANADGTGDALIGDAPIGETDPGCPLGRVRCGGVCIDVRADLGHCGSCENACTIAAPSTVECVAGRCLATLVSAPGAAGSMAIDGTNVYWINTITGNISRVPIAGGTATNVVAGRTSPNLLAVDTTNIYWTDNSSSSEAAIMKAALADGTTAVVVPKSGQPRRFALDATSLYYTTGYALAKVPLGGGAPGTLTPAGVGAIGLTIDATHAYFTTSAEVSRVPLAGGAVEKIAWGQGSPTWLAVTGSEIFWTSNDPYNNGMSKAPKAGGEWKKFFGGVYNFVLTDGTSVYYKTYDDLMKMPTSGTGSTSIWSSKGSPAAGMVDAALDAKNFYWVGGTSGAMRVMRLWPR